MTFSVRSYWKKARNANVIEQVVDGRDHRADAEAELEPEREVRQDADERQHRRPEPLLVQLAADRRADDFGALAA